MIVYPHSKINLGLHITQKREDGFHDLETFFYPISLRDALEIIPAPDGKTEFFLSGEEIPGPSDKNLCIKAWQILQKTHAIPPVKIHLHKVIPTGAGLGGGSSDAAFTLKTLNELFDKKISREKLKQYASELGSDCSFFLEDSPAYATGRGEILTPYPLSLNGFYLLLVIPDIHISTAEAYAGISPAKPEIPLKEILAYPLEKWSINLKNDFEKNIFNKYPEIKKIKTELYNMGAIYASMSGSGASVFGIFNQKPKDDDKKLFENHFLWEEILR